MVAAPVKKGNHEVIRLSSDGRVKNGTVDLSNEIQEQSNGILRGKLLTLLKFN